MTFTYDAGSGLPLDEVREMIGDVRIDDPFLADETIQLQMTRYPNLAWVASRCAAMIGADLARLVDSKSGGTDNKDSQRYAAFMKLSAYWRMQALRSGSGIIPYAGGLSLDEKEERRENPDLVPPDFFRQMQQNPGAGYRTSLPVQSDLLGDDPLGEESW